MALKTCKVSCFDLYKLNIRLKLVPAASMRRSPRPCKFSVTDEWVEEIGHCQTSIFVKVKSPEISIRFAYKTSNAGWKRVRDHPLR